jgi:hypothetical protein
MPKRSTTDKPRSIDKLLNPSDRDKLFNLIHQTLDSLTHTGALTARDYALVRKVVLLTKSEGFMSDALRAVVEEGKNAWGRIKLSSKQQRASYNDWRSVSEALQVGEYLCSKITGKHENEKKDSAKGGAYNRAIKIWLMDNGLYEIKRGIRSKLRDIRRNAVEIERWRIQLSIEERAKFNHPKIVLEHFYEWQKQQKTQQPNLPLTPSVSTTASQPVHPERTDPLERIREWAGSALPPKQSALSLKQFLALLKSCYKISRDSSLSPEKRQVAQQNFGKASDEWFRLGYPDETLKEHLSQEEIDAVQRHKPQ